MIDNYWDDCSIFVAESQSLKTKKKDLILYAIKDDGNAILTEKEVKRKLEQEFPTCTFNNVDFIISGWIAKNAQF